MIKFSFSGLDCKAFGSQYHLCVTLGAMLTSMALPEKLTPIYFLEKRYDSGHLANSGTYLSRKACLIFAKARSSGIK